MKTTLKHIASIQTGVFAKPIQKGEIVYLQSKHFDEYGELAETLFPDLNADDRINKHLLINGDVLFAAKGAKNFAACYEEGNKLAVASTSFFVIRLYNKNVLPTYLNWFLNHPDTLAYLKSKAKGTSIASISKVVLSELELNIPSLLQQEKILQIDKLYKKEKRLKLQIENLRDKQIQQKLIIATK